MFRIFLIIFVLATASLCAAQEPKQPVQATATGSSARPSEAAKGEVDLALEEFKKRGELVLAACLEKCADKNTISSGVVAGKAVELPQPPYPKIAVSAHASGDVVVMIIIDKEGKVAVAQIVSGHPLLFGASLRAAKASRFTPTLHEGKPVNVVGKLVYHFLR